MHPESYRRRPSVLAIAGLACSFFIGPVGLVLSVLGFREIQRSNGRVAGKELAIAGIVVSSLWVLGACLYYLVLTAFQNRMGISD